MKTCTYCGRENEDQATKCQECGTEFVRGSASAGDTSPESDEAERFEKAAVLDNEVQAELMDAVLSERKIPHIMQSYHDSALDGLFQIGKGWGVILAPESSKAEIVAALAEIRRQSETTPSSPEGGNA
jgi:hypothetical protein